MNELNERVETLRFNIGYRNTIREIHLNMAEYCGMESFLEQMSCYYEDEAEFDSKMKLYEEWNERDAAEIEAIVKRIEEIA